MSSHNPISVDTSSDEEFQWDPVTTVEKSTKKRKALLTVSEYTTLSMGKAKSNILDDSFQDDDDEDDSIRESLVQGAASSVAKVPAAATTCRNKKPKKDFTPNRVAKTLVYPTTCPDFEMKLGHIPLWMVMIGTGKQSVNFSKKAHTLPKDGEKVAKRSNSDKNLDGVPAPPAWAVTLNGRERTRTKSYKWKLSLDQIRAYILDKETFVCTVCGEDRLPHQMFVDAKLLNSGLEKMTCISGICQTLQKTYAINLKEYIRMLENQVNDQGNLVCILCGDPFVKEMDNCWSIFNCIKHHDHRAEGNRKFGSTKTQQSGNGLVGVAHVCCNNPSLLERMLDYDAGKLAAHFKKMSAGWEKQEEMWSSETLPIYKMRKEKKEAKKAGKCSDVEVTSETGN